MAKLVMTYTSDGKVKSELTYKNTVFDYTMIPDDAGKTADKPAFDIQVEEKFPNEPEEVLEALESICFADEDEIEQCLLVLEENE